MGSWSFGASEKEQGKWEMPKPPKWETVSSSAYPSMPPDFWPDEITISAKHQGVDIGFTLARGHVPDADFPDELRKRIDALCHALWVGGNWTNEHMRVADLRKSNG